MKRAQKTSFFLMLLAIRSIAFLAGDTADSGHAHNLDPEREECKMVVVTVEGPEGTDFEGYKSTFYQIGSEMESTPLHFSGANGYTLMYIDEATLESVYGAHVFSAGDEEPTDLTLDEDFASLNKDADITITRTDYRHLRPQCGYWAIGKDGGEKIPVYPMVMVEGCNSSSLEEVDSSQWFLQDCYQSVSSASVCSPQSINEVLIVVSPYDCGFVPTLAHTIPFTTPSPTQGDILGCEKVSIIIEKLKGMEFETHSGTFYKVEDSSESLVSPEYLSASGFIFLYMESETPDFLTGDDFPSDSLLDLDSSTVHIIRRRYLATCGHWVIGVRGEDGTVQYPMFNVQDCASSVEYIDPNSEWFFQLCGDTKPSCDPEPVAEVLILPSKSECDKPSNISPAISMPTPAPSLRSLPGPAKAPALSATPAPTNSLAFTATFSPSPPPKDGNADWTPGPSLQTVAPMLAPSNRPLEFNEGKSVDGIDMIGLGIGLATTVVVVSVVALIIVSKLKKT